MLYHEKRTFKKSNEQKTASQNVPYNLVNTVAIVSSKALDTVDKFEYLTGQQHLLIQQKAWTFHHYYKPLTKQSK